MFTLRLNSTSRFVAMLLTLLLAAFAVPACGDKDSNGFNPEDFDWSDNEDDEPAERMGHITVGEGADRVIADREITLEGSGTTEPAFKASATVSATWNDPEASVKSGKVTAIVAIWGIPKESNLDVHTYEFVDDVGTTPPESPIASLTLEGVIVNGAPMKLIATDGGITGTGLGTANGALWMIEYSFDGIFKNASDPSDTAEYPLKGRVVVGHDY